MCQFCIILHQNALKMLQSETVFSTENALKVVCQPDSAETRLGSISTLLCPLAVAAEGGGNADQGFVIFSFRFGRNS